MIAQTVARQSTQSGQATGLPSPSKRWSPAHSALNQAEQAYGSDRDEVGSSTFAAAQAEVLEVEAIGETILRAARKIATLYNATSNVNSVSDRLNAATLAALFCDVLHDADIPLDAYRLIKAAMLCAAE